MHTRLPGLVLASAVLALTPRGAARAADAPLPLTVAGITGPRSLALAGGVGLPTGTEAIYVNPAALAARKRFAIDGMFAWDARPGQASPANRAQYFGGAVADSVSAPLAAGVSYLRALNGVQNGNLLQLALAGALTDGFLVGLTGKYYSLDGSTQLPADLRNALHVKTTLNMDAGLFWQVTRQVSLGGAAYNLIGNNKDSTMPQEFGAGVALGSETSLQVTADWRVNTEACFTATGQPALCVEGAGLHKRSASKYGGGIEYLFDHLIPVRGGFQVDDVSKTKWWSAGLGLVTTQAAVDVGYRQSVDKANARTIMIAVRGFLPNE